MGVGKSLCVWVGLCGCRQVCVGVGRSLCV